MRRTSEGRPGAPSGPLPRLSRSPTTPAPDAQAAGGAVRGDCSRAAVSSRPSPDHVPPTPSTSFRNKCGDGVWTRGLRVHTCQCYMYVPCRCPDLDAHGGVSVWADCWAAVPLSLTSLLPHPGACAHRSWGPEAADSQLFLGVPALPPHSRNTSHGVCLQLTCLDLQGPISPAPPRPPVSWSSGVAGHMQHSG